MSVGAREPPRLVNLVGAILIEALAIADYCLIGFRGGRRKLETCRLAVRRDCRTASPLPPLSRRVEPRDLSELFVSPSS